MRNSRSLLRDERKEEEEEKQARATGEKFPVPFSTILHGWFCKIPGRVKTKRNQSFLVRRFETLN
jgi:hypothetical protein